METIDGQVVGGLIGLGLIVKGFAEWAVRRNCSKTHDMPCNVTPSYLEECEKHRQNVLMKLTEIIVMLRERKG